MTQSSATHAELELAARLADNAADGLSADEVPPPDQQRTMVKSADADYQRAIDDLAHLVELRREVSLSAAFHVAGEHEPTSADAIGHWGPFELLERLGGGASGEVYKVRDKHLNNHVALKLFHEERVASVELDALLVEGRQHALVKHPNIAVIHGADENDGRVGIWMEYLDGATLQELVETQGTFGAAEAVVIARELCSALAAVHQQGLTHGDIKAQNVMREKGGRIVLMDFSSSRHIELDDDAHGGLVGTPIYMAPELFDGHPSDFLSDIYALGVLLFYLVTGRHPYEAQTLKSLKHVVRTNKPLLLDDLRFDLPTEFVRAVHRAIAPTLGDRFQSTGEFQVALREASLVDAPGVATPLAPETSTDLRPLVRAARVLTGTVFVTAFLAMLGYGNEILFNTTLQIPYKLTNYSLVAAAVVGLRSLSFLIVNAVMCAVVLAVVFGVSRIIGTNPLGRIASRVSERLRRVDFVRVASLYALLCVAVVAATVLYFSDFLGAIAATSSGDVSMLRLACGGEPEQAIRFGLGISRVVLFVGLGWWLVFERLKPATPLAPTARLMRGVSALAIVVSIGVMATPWRLLWQSEALPIALEDTKGFVVAEDNDTLYVYAPEAPAHKRHRVILRDELVANQVDSTPAYLYGEQSCGNGGGS